MTIRTIQTQTQFERHLTLMENAVRPNSNLVIDQKLEVVSKRSFLWCVLTFWRPLAYVLRIDMYSYFRANIVAESLFRLCRDKTFIRNNTALLERAVNVIRTLDQKTNQEYESVRRVIAAFERNITALTPPQQEAETRFNWPTDLNELGIDQNEQITIQMALNRYGHYPHTSFSKDNSIRRIHYYRISPWTNRQEVASTVEVPISLFFVQKNGQNRVLLILKKIIGCGAEGKVRLCYDLTTGEFLARKKMTGNAQEIFRLFNQLNIQGVTRLLYTRTFNNKTQVIQTRYRGDVTNILPTLSTTPQENFAMAIGLLKTLKTLHALSFQNRPFAHLDIKPKNIFIEQESSKDAPKAIIGDFDLCCSNSCLGSIGYRSPERIRSIEELHCLRAQVPNTYMRSNHEIALCRLNRAISHLNVGIGQKADVWAMGLVIVKIFTSKIRTPEHFNHFPLMHNYLRKLISPSNREGNLQLERGNIAFFNLPLLRPSQMIEKEMDIGLGSITQREIDEDLDRLKILNPLYSPMWDFIKTMLQVDPKKRITAKKAYRDFKKVRNNILAIISPFQEQIVSTNERKHAPTSTLTS